MTHPSTTRLSSWRRLLFGLALLLSLCALTGGLARPAHAASTLKVTNCSSDSQLQADVAQANHDNAGEVIRFACSGDIKLTSTLTINGSMTLSGSGQQVILDGGDSRQVLYVTNGVSFTLSALTIAHGATRDGGTGGGLDNELSTVTISNSTFANNSAPDGYGGGLDNDFGTVTISNSTFANNSANGSGPLNGGGGLANNGGTVTISNSTFANNSAFAGGGINGGGQGTEGTESISNSTFANNSASYGNGGALAIIGDSVTISNSTIANNSTGIINGDTLTISNSTIADNAGVGIFTYVGTLNIGGSIVADNTGGDCFNDILTDNGYNLSSDSSCGFTGTGDLQNSNPQLGPLASNGGPTQTLAPLKSSPAIDAIPLSSGLCPATDQRGHKRPDNPLESACDIGAVES